MLRRCAVGLWCLLTGCQSIGTDIESSVAPAFEGRLFRRICVASPEGDLRIQRAVEGTVAEKLVELGVECVQLGRLLFAGKEYDEEEVRKAVREIGADGYLTIVPLQTWVDEYYVPPSASVGGGWHPYCWGYSTNWVSGGYTVSRPQATFDVRLMDVATEEVAWIASVGVSGSSGTSWVEMRRAAAEVAVGRLVADGLVAVGTARIDG